MVLVYLTKLNVVTAREIIEEEGVYYRHLPFISAHASTLVVGVVVVEQTPVQIQRGFRALNWQRGHAPGFKDG